MQHEIAESIGGIVEEAIELYEAARTSMTHQEALLYVKIELMAAAHKGWSPSDRWAIDESITADDALISETCERR